MKSQVKLLSLLLGVLLLLGACAPAAPAAPEATTAPETTPAAETPVEESIFTPGTYTGTGVGHAGALSVAITVDENTIQSVELTESAETKGIGDVAFDKIQSYLLTYQNLPADTVAGCTISAAAIRTAASEALTEATGGDIGKLQGTEPPAPSTETITMDTDVLVLGAGAAGLSAAVTAAENGAKVIVLEKLPRTGGSTRTSSGMVVAGGTPVQAEGGIEDSIEDLQKYWLDRGEGNVDEEMVIFAAQHAPDSLQFLMDHGVTYLPEGITTSGTTDVLRAHVPPTNGVEFIDQLVASAEALGVEIVLETPATKLITDANGAVIGAEASQNGTPVVVNAKSVVIATGGYDKNEEMKAQFAPRAVGAWAVSAPGNTGDGIRMGMDVGADTVFKNAMLGWKVLSPAFGHTSSFGGLVRTTTLVVDNTGARFVNEALDYPFIFHAMTENAGGTFYYIYDSTYDRPERIEAGMANNMVTKAETIEELGQALNLPGLADTVARYNELAANGSDEDFGKDAALLNTLEVGPFYAAQAMPATLGSFGGLKVTIPGNVLNANGEAIGGLYAAGECANGDFFGTTYPASGSSLSMCVTFGIEAGKSAAAFAAE